MFPGIILETYSISSIKISYLISEAVGPYFNTINIKDVKKSSSPFTICYNETTNKQVKKQLGIELKFSSETDSAVRRESFKNVLTGHATGVLLKIMKYVYRHFRPLKVMIQVLIKLFGINKMNKSHQKEKGKFR